MDEIFFTCAECGKRFPPDPDTMHTLEVGAFLINEFSGELVELDPSDISEDEIPEEEKNNGICICHECFKNLPTKPNES
jgi:hypothetical protein